MGADETDQKLEEIAVSVEIELTQLSMRAFESLPYIDPQGKGKSWEYEGQVICIRWPCSINGPVIAEWEGIIIIGDFGYYRVGDVRNSVRFDWSLLGRKIH